MFGRDARFGLIVPSSNTVAEHEISAYLPVECALFTTRVLTRATSDPGEKVAGFRSESTRSRLAEAVAELSTLQPQGIAWACTAAGFLATDGRAFSEEGGGAAPLISTAEALVGAVRTLTGAAGNKVLLVTPYHESMAIEEADYLRMNCTGVEVEMGVNLGIVDGYPKGNLEPVESFRAVRQSVAEAVSRPDVIVVSCTNWRSREAVPLLEESLGVPIVSSNLATAWALLGLAGIEPVGNEELWRHPSSWS